MPFYEEPKELQNQGKKTALSSLHIALPQGYQLQLFGDLLFPKTSPLAPDPASSLEPKMALSGEHEHGLWWVLPLGYML